MAATNGSGPPTPCTGILGGQIPTVAEWSELIRNGADGGATLVWRWAADALYWWSGGYGHPLVRWTKTANAHWTWYGWGGTSGPASLAAPESTHAYRCIWRSKRAALPTCQANEVLVADQTNGGFKCTPPTAGDSGGQGPKPDLGRLGQRLGRHRAG